MATIGLADFLPIIGPRRRRRTLTRVLVENPLFDRQFYAAQYPDVVKGGVDLYEHYEYYGAWNGCNPNEYFESAWYLGQYPDVFVAGPNPLDHYLEYGLREGRDPSRAFSTWLYMTLYPDVKASGMNPLLHFMQRGRSEGRSPPPVVLVPSLATMSTRPSDNFGPEAASSEPVIRLLHEWTGLLLDRTASAPGVGEDSGAP